MSGFLNRPMASAWEKFCIYIGAKSLSMGVLAVMFLAVLYSPSRQVLAQQPTGSLAEQLTKAVPADDPDQSFRVLCYHDIRDNLLETFKTRPEPTAVDTLELIREFSWLQENGYHPVSLQQIIDARAGKSRLPDKAVLLTFDDGYQSVYDKVFPLLKLFHYPAVIAIVGEWIETPPDQQVLFGDNLLARDQFVNWNDIKTMMNSGLVEVASHSHDLHKGIIANPQGNSLPAAISRYFKKDSKEYETDAQYTARVREDLLRNSDLIEKKLQFRPRAMVWPYGRYNREAIQWAANAGMTVTMNLEAGPNTSSDSLDHMRRTLMGYDTHVSDLIQMLHEPVGYSGRKFPIERVIHVDLDYIYDPDPVQQEVNISQLLDRIKRIRPSTVYLQAFADPDGDGVADAVYFPNRHLPMRADLFSRVAWQLSTRVGVNVYAWMPVMAFKLPQTDSAADKLVQIMPGAPASASVDRYRRLSIFDPAARQAIQEIYEDLGKSAIFDGILFHDDATLSDYEDASPVALQFYHDNWQLPASVQEIRQSDELRNLWTKHKTAYIDAFTMTLADTLRQYQPMLVTARNIYAQPVLDPDAEEWYAQDMHAFLKTYDYTVIMAMPYMEGAADPDRWLTQLFSKVKAIPGALDRTVFELQSKNWKTNEPIDSKLLARQMKKLHLQGVRNFGYYPDDFQTDTPNEAIIKSVLSVESNLPVKQK